MERNMLSRREMLRGSAFIAAGLAAASAVGCSPSGNGGTTSDKSSQSTADTQKAHTWEVKPEPIKDITETVENEVIIVGGGSAGCIAALSCAENGLGVTVIEAGDRPHGNSCGYGALGSRMLDEIGNNIDPDHEMQYWMTACGGRVRHSLVGKFFRNSERCMNWLLDVNDKYGGTPQIFNGAPGKMWHECVDYHWFWGVDLDDGFENKEQSILGGFDYVVRMVALEAQTYGAQIVYNTFGRQLVQDESGAVTGIICESDGKYIQYNASKAVILATGDVCHSDEYKEAFFGSVRNAVNIQPCSYNVGDGHNMASWAGAALQEGPWATCLDFEGGAAFRGPFLMVTPDGKRIANEGCWAPQICKSVLDHGYTEAWSVFDANWVKDLEDSLQYGGGGFWGYYIGYDATYADQAAAYQTDIETGIKEQPDLYKRADSLEELADMMDIDKDAFLATVDRYNGFCEDGKDVDFFKNPNLLYPLKEGPFIACRCIPSYLTSMSGIHIDDNFAVLTADDQIIPNLYAIGNCAGDMYAIDYPIELQGNSHGHCLVMGKLIGEYLAGLDSDPLAQK